MSTGTTMSVSSNDVTLGHKNHWLKFSVFIFTKAKAYGDVSRLLQYRAPIDYFTLILAEKERQQLARYHAQKSSAESKPRRSVRVKAEKIKMTKIVKLKQAHLLLKLIYKWI
jgi:hypothetical protein